MLFYSLFNLLSEQVLSLKAEKILPRFFYLHKGRPYHGRGTGAFKKLWKKLRIKNCQMDCSHTGSPNVFFTLGFSKVSKPASTILDATNIDTENSLKHRYLSVSTSMKEFSQSSVVIYEQLMSTYWEDFLANLYNVKLTQVMLLGKFI